MRSIVALIRVNWITFTSYRLNVVFSAFSLVALFVPVYLISDALQPVVADSIADEGQVYFGFLITGLAVMQVVGASMRVLPQAISSGIASGTLEALLATPTPLPTLLLGLQGYGLLWGLLKGLLLLVGFAVVGGGITWGGVPLAILVLAITVLAHLPVGLFGASLILIFRTAGPLVQGASAAVTLLGGVYYSTTVIPEIVRPLAGGVPLTYGLRAFRQLVLSGASFSDVTADLVTLTGLAAGFLVAGLLLLGWSLRYAQRVGSLAQY